MTADGTLKVSDFGLARKMYYEVYHKNVTSTVRVRMGRGKGREKEEGGNGVGWEWRQDIVLCTEVPQLSTSPQGREATCVLQQPQSSPPHRRASL